MCLISLILFSSSDLYIFSWLLSTSTCIIVNIFSRWPKSSPQYTWGGQNIDLAQYFISCTKYQTIQIFKRIKILDQQDVCSDEPSFVYNYTAINRSVIPINQGNACSKCISTSLLFWNLLFALLNNLRLVFFSKVQKPT